MAIQRKRTRTKTVETPSSEPLMQKVYVPLHQKYRPKRFSELVGQEAVAQTLSNAIKQRRIAPAYLFSGIRGTGKTSSARILAKSLNCLSADKPTVTPCGECEVCHSVAVGSNIDVVEIDAASNTGVDNVRKLIESAHLMPMQCRYQVWIIDEVHKLSNAAMNALLKVLEEPPDKVVFILATTEPEQVLETIRSRCQQYPFLPIDLEIMADHLAEIAAHEGIDLTPGAVARVAQASGGGMRDATSLLDQLSLLPAPVTVEVINQLTGAVPEQALLKMLQTLVLGDDAANGAADYYPLTVLEQSQGLSGRGKTPMAILEGLSRIVQLAMVAKFSEAPPKLTPVMPQTWMALRELAEEVDLSLLRQINAVLRAGEPQIRQAASPQLWLEALLVQIAAAAEAAIGKG